MTICRGHGLLLPFPNTFCVRRFGSGVQIVILFTQNVQKGLLEVATKNYQSNIKIQAKSKKKLPFRTAFYHNHLILNTILSF